MPLYQRVMGQAWESLPIPIKTLHQPQGNSWSAEGRATVERGRGLLSRMIGKLIGFPDTGRNIPVKVVFELTGSGETWHRNFAGRSFRSFQWVSADAGGKLLGERFGALDFGLELAFDGTRLHLIIRRWSAFGIPLPLALAPIGQSCEFVEHGRFNFYVEIAHTWIGLIVRYQGWLAP
jgi:hypothetical protein